MRKAAGPAQLPPPGTPAPPGAGTFLWGTPAAALDAAGAFFRLLPPRRPGGPRRCSRAAGARPGGLACAVALPEAVGGQGQAAGALGREGVRDGPQAARPDVFQLGARGGAVADVQLAAVRAVVGGEQEQVAEGRQLRGRGGGAARADVADQLGARAGAVADEQLAAVGAVVGGEEQRVADRG